MSNYVGKYIGLYNFFIVSENDTEILSYQEIEKIIGDKLPKSAYEYSAWLQYSKTHTATLSWINAGWTIEKLELGKQVTFKKSAINEITNRHTIKQTVQKKSKNKKQIPPPTVEEIDKYLKLWDSLENYVLQEHALEKLFTVTYPNNKKIEDVLIKVCALNDFYSTQIMKPITVAKHIIELDIDKNIKSNDIEIVNKVAMVNVGKREINFYSFATKYLSHHKPTVYPIYDYYVEMVLWHFKNEDKFCQFKKEDLKDYGKFINILNSFRKFYKVENYDLKKIDKYLWQTGKEFFPRKYKKG